MKVIQIIRGSDEQLLALCDDGSIWEYSHGSWSEFDSLPKRTGEQEFQKAAKVVFKPILDRQEKEKLEDETPARKEAIEELGAKTRKALRQARWRAKKKAGK